MPEKLPVYVRTSDFCSECAFHSVTYQPQPGGGFVRQFRCARADCDFYEGHAPITAAEVLPEAPIAPE